MMDAAQAYFLLASERRFEEYWYDRPAALYKKREKRAKAVKAAIAALRRGVENRLPLRVPALGSVRFLQRS